MDQLFNSERPFEPSISRTVATDLKTAAWDMVPVLGIVMGAVVSTEQAQHDAEDANNRANLKTRIHDRKEHLVTLYDRKNCDQGTGATKGS